VTLTARNSIVHHQLAGCRHTSGTERRRTWNQQASNHIKQHEHKPLLETISSKKRTARHNQGMIMRAGTADLITDEMCCCHTRREMLSRYPAYCTDTCHKQRRATTFSTAAGIICKGFRLFSRLLQIVDSNTFVLVPYPELQLPQ
jgi:hypothetical protein